MVLMDTSDQFFGQIRFIFKAKKYILKVEVPKTCKKFLLEALDCNGGGPGRVLEGKNGLEALVQFSLVLFVYQTPTMKDKPTGKKWGYCENM